MGSRTNSHPSFGCKTSLWVAFILSLVRSRWLPSDETSLANLDSFPLPMSPTESQIATLGATGAANLWSQPDGSSRRLVSRVVS